MDIEFIYLSDNLIQVFFFGLDNNSTTSEFPTSSKNLCFRLTWTSIPYCDINISNSFVFSILGMKRMIMKLLL